MSEEENLTGIDAPIPSVRIMNKSQLQSSAQYIDSAFLNTSSLIHRNVENLESRVTTCNSIYKLATDTNDLRQKEQSQQIRNVNEYLETIEKRVDAIERYLIELPENVRIETRKIIDNKNIYSDIESQISQFDDEMNDKFNALEALIEDNDKQNTKKYKKIKNDIELIGTEQSNGVDVEGFRSQLHDIETKNKQIRSMAQSLKSQFE